MKNLMMNYLNKVTEHETCDTEMTHFKIFIFNLKVLKTKKFSDILKMSLFGI